MKTAILGAGLAGITLGRKLNALRRSFVVFEKESSPGGMCRTNRTGEYSWDFGVHAIYSRSDKAMAFVRSLPVSYVPSVRAVKVFHTAGRRRFLLDYPFEVGIKGLPISQRLECIAGYLGARLKNSDAANLEDWIHSCLGRGIANHFMVSYNAKIWNCPLSAISKDIVTSKIEPEPVMRFLKAALGGAVVGRAHQANFIYPEGGLQTMIDCLARDISPSIRLNCEVNKLERKGDRWIVHAGNGLREEFDAVISTIPLVELLQKTSIEEIGTQSDALKWNDTYFVMVGLKKGRRFGVIDDCHWVFFKENEIFYRITMMHNFSPAFPPALVAEITKKGSGYAEPELCTTVIDDLLRQGILASKDDVALTEVRSVAYTYPIPTVGLDALKRRITAAAEKNKLFLFGRNGNWDYLNIDGIILKAEEFVPYFCSKAYRMHYPGVSGQC